MFINTVSLTIRISILSYGDENPVYHQQIERFLKLKIILLISLLSYTSLWWYRYIFLYEKISNQQFNLFFVLFVVFFLSRINSGQ